MATQVEGDAGVVVEGTLRFQEVVYSALEEQDAGFGALRGAILADLSQHLQAFASEVRVTSVQPGSVVVTFEVDTTAALHVQTYLEDTPPTVDNALAALLELNDGAAPGGVASVFQAGVDISSTAALQGSLTIGVEAAIQASPLPVRSSSPAAPVNGPWGYVLGAVGVVVCVAVGMLLYRRSLRMREQYSGKVAPSSVLPPPEDSPVLENVTSGTGVKMSMGPLPVGSKAPGGAAAQSAGEDQGEDPSTHAERRFPNHLKFYKPEQRGQTK